MVPILKQNFILRSTLILSYHLPNLKRSYGFFCLDFPVETFMYFILAREGEMKYELHYMPTCFGQTKCARHYTPTCFGGIYCVHCSRRILRTDGTWTLSSSGYCSAQSVFYNWNYEATKIIVQIKLKLITRSYWDYMKQKFKKSVA